MDEVSFLVCDYASAPTPYSAVQLRRQQRSDRAKALAAACLGALLVIAAAALVMQRGKAIAPGPGAIADAVSEIRGAPSAAHEQKAASMQSLQGVPGVLAPPPPGGYNVFDPHYSEDGIPSSHTGGTEKGVFTGHSIGSPGGPLTFGPNTYWNVFDPNGSPDMGPCDPGSTGQAGTATQKRDCRECSVGKWCPGGEDSLEHDCPHHSTSFVGSYDAKQCTCQLGWYGVAHYSTTHGCTMCLADTYCPGGRKQFACPAHSSSPDEASYCTCDPSYYGVTHDDCKLCDANFFCPGGDPLGQEQYACTPNSNSPAGSDDGTDCQCNPSYYEPVASDEPSQGPDCVVCPANTYCPGGASNAQCTADSSSPAGSDEGTDCLCNPGYYGSSSQGCARCPAGSYCPGGTAAMAVNIVACPANSNSPEGSTKLSHCTCNPSYMGTDPTDCQLCPAGSYCPGDGAVVTCTANAHSAPGSTSCSCNDGFVRKNDGTCFRCPADHFCPRGDGDYQPTECPENTIAPRGSMYAHDCKCLPGFENSAYADANNWVVVDAGTFADVQQRCVDEDAVIASINTIAEQNAANSKCSECWIGLQRDVSGNGWTNENPSPWYFVDGHEIDFTMWQLGKPDNSGETNVRYKLDGSNAWWDDHPSSASFRGICKKNNVPPRATAVYSPMALGLNTGYIADFFYIGHSVSSLPSDIIERSVPNSESVVDGIPFPSDNSFHLVDGNMPHDQIAGTWTGMLEIMNAGTYQFSTASDDGSHLYIDGTLVVNNGGLHGTERKEGSMSLAVGYHMVKADWFENGGGASMVVQWKGADTANNWEAMQVVHWKRGQTALPDPGTLGYTRGWMTRIWWFNHDVDRFPVSETNRNPNKVVVVPEVKFDDQGWKDLGVPDERFAVMLSGMIAIYETGYYDFYTSSDDGSHLYIDGLMVVDNGGLHGTTKKRGNMLLSHGFHSVMVDFFENSGDAYLDLSYKGADTDGVEIPIDAFVPPGAPGAPPAPPLTGDGPLAQVTLQSPPAGNNGEEMPLGMRGRNMKCSQFANQAQRKSKFEQLKLMANCMNQDCEQSMEVEVGCQYVTPGPGFCYTNPGQEFCKENPSSPQCVKNFNDGSEWTPVAQFPFVGSPAAGNINFNKFSCVCAKDCTFQRSIRALKCYESKMRQPPRGLGQDWDIHGYGGNFVGPRGDSVFKRNRLNQAKGDEGIFRSDGKRNSCACVCGKGDTWVAMDGKVQE